MIKLLSNPWLVLFALLIVGFVINELIEMVKTLSQHWVNRPRTQKEGTVNTGLMNEYTKLSSRCIKYMEDHIELRTSNEILERQVKDIRKEWQAASEKINQLKNEGYKKDEDIKHLTDLLKDSDIHVKYKAQLEENKRMAIELEDALEGRADEDTQLIESLRLQVKEAQDSDAARKQRVDSLLVLLDTATRKAEAQDVVIAGLRQDLEQANEKLKWWEEDQVSRLKQNQKPQKST
jgi:chromosome segregation ATPase